MANDLRFEQEIADDNATLYCWGALHANHVVAIERACAALQSRVRSLRLDMHGVSNMAEDAMDAVRGVLRFWRTSRTAPHGAARKLTSIVVPRPGLLSAATSPPWASTRCFTIDSPSPVPPASRDRPASTR